jgi:hypothetical protein
VHQLWVCIKPLLKGPVLYTVFIPAFCVTEKGFVIKKKLGCKNKNLLEYVVLSLYLQKEKGGKGYLQGLKVLTNEKRGGLKVVAFDKSPFKLFTLRFSTKSVQAPSCKRPKTTQRTLFLSFQINNWFPKTV